MNLGAFDLARARIMVRYSGDAMTVQKNGGWLGNGSALWRYMLVCVKCLLQKLVHLQPVTLGNGTKTVVKLGTNTGRKLVCPSRPACAAAILE